MLNHRFIFSNCKSAIKNRKFSYASCDRDFQVNSGRIDARRATLFVRPADGLPDAVRVVR